MRIEKIELIGFKSFADKISFALHPGITCIVGPNGCGKSNIVDAFRWVLGEQSAKSLRGEKMEEVIFSGSASKKPKGMSEVTLEISGIALNTEQGGNGGSGHLVVSRRLYRSGESEYLINRQPCRLKDIKDIFLDTGLDAKSYSILEQGRIGAIINSKPIERRFVIEEVAGVMKYKVRKAEALSKLEASRLNLSRINDIVIEVKKQIGILDRLAKKAERYRKLLADLHAIELKIARRDYQQIKETLAALTEEHTGLKEQETVRAANINGIENRNQTRRIAQIEKEKALDGVQQAFSAMEKEIGDLERLIAVCRNDITNLDEYRGRLIQQEEDLVRRGSEAAARSEELKMLSTQVSGELENIHQTLRDRAEHLRGLEEGLADTESVIEDLRREIFRVSEEISRLGNDLARQQSAIESLQRREDVSRRESDDARKKLAEIEAAISAVEAEILGRNNESLLLRDKKEVLTNEHGAAKTRLADLSAKLSVAREDLASSVSRLESLKEIVFDRSTREILAGNEQVRILAAVSDIFEVKADYEKAIENALAGKADTLIVSSKDDVEQAVALLQSGKAEKTALITATMPAGPAPASVPEGILGRAVDFVAVSGSYEHIARNLLGRILIVRDLRTALDLHERDSSFVYATVTGEVVDQTGTVLVGEERGIFRRKREIRELEQGIEEKKTANEKLTEEIGRTESLIRDREEALAAVQTQIHDFEKEISLSRLTVENFTEEKDRTSRKLAYLTMEIEQIVREKTAGQQAAASCEAQIKDAESRREAKEKSLFDLQQAIGEKKSELENARAVVTELKLQAASNRERLEAVKGDIDDAGRTIVEVDAQRVKTREDRESVISRIGQREDEIRGHEERLRKLVADADGLRQDIGRRREEIETENEDLMTVEQELRTARQELSAITTRLSELDVSRTELKMRIGNLTENTMNNYGVNLEEVEMSEITPEEEERLVDLRAKIQEIGPVNLGTLDEYEELKGRYDFLSKQQEDLNRSIAELEEAISKINSTTRKKLRDAYEALNAKFGEIFTRLFGGGRAELVLTDEHNILETGIDIVAQPPGKKIQNIHLLSGGEQALTALSLQFASFLIKPTPLCILDEADAPLDESNTERYSQMLLELSQETQFIVVTHNRTTMGAAQHLYGITMEEAGVSKVISMQLAGV